MPEKSGSNSGAIPEAILFPEEMPETSGSNSGSIPEAISFPEEMPERSGSNSGSNFVSGGISRKVRKQFQKYSGSNSGSNFVSGGNARKVRKQFRKYSRTIPEAISFAEVMPEKSGSNSGSIPELFRKHSGSNLNKYRILNLSEEKNLTIIGRQWGNGG